MRAYIGRNTSENSSATYAKVEYMHTLSSSDLTFRNIFNKNVYIYAFKEIRIKDLGIIIFNKQNLEATKCLSLGL